MTPINRPHRYFGMTSTQVGILFLLMGTSCLILGIGAIIIISLQAPNSVAITKAQLPTLVTEPVRTAPTQVHFPSTWTPTPEPLATSTRAPTPTFTPTATRLPRVTPLIDEWSRLDSYHLQVTLHLDTEPASQFIQWQMLYDWVNRPNAFHLVLSSEGTGLLHPGSVMNNVETIYSEGTTWNKVDGQWLQAQSLLSQFMHGEWWSFEVNSRDLRFAGEETVNGVQCKHYTVNGVPVSISELGFQLIKSDAQGDIWVAHQPDLPAVVIRMQIQMRTKDFSMLAPRATPPPTSIWRWDCEVTRINTPIVIRPPASYISP